MVSSIGRHYSWDVAHFVARSPYLQLAKPPAARRFLRRNVQLAEECGPTLAAYPGVLVEPLEFFYRCLHSLGALDLDFMQALLSEHNWRGVVWGAWLAILEPGAHFEPALSSVHGRSPHNDWLVECALATIRGVSSSPEHAEILQLSARCRELLRDVKRPVVRLRREPTAVQYAQMNQEREGVRAAYASGGAEAARALLPGTLLELYSKSYPAWAASAARL